MPGSSALFMILAGLMTLIGLFSAAAADRYLYTF